MIGGRCDIRRSEIERAKTASIVDVVEFLGLHVPGNKQICCPFHLDHRPSMKLYEESERAFCFACHKVFDVIDFVMKCRGLAFESAVEFLLENFETYEPTEEDRSSSLPPLSFMLKDIPREYLGEFSEFVDALEFEVAQGRNFKESAAMDVLKRFYELRVK